MDTETIVKTTNEKLIEATNVCVGINDALTSFIDALQDILSGITAIYSESVVRGVNDFITLPILLKEAGFENGTIVGLTEIYHANRCASSSTPPAIISALTAGAQHWIEKFVGALQNGESAISLNDISNIFRLYRDSVNKKAETVNEKVEEKDDGR